MFGGEFGFSIYQTNQPKMLLFIYHFELKGNIIKLVDILGETIDEHYSQRSERKELQCF